jgi:hypothetical protein
MKRLAHPTQVWRVSNAAWFGQPPPMIHDFDKHCADVASNAKTHILILLSPCSKSGEKKGLRETNVNTLTKRKSFQKEKYDT